MQALALSILTLFGGLIACKRQEVSAEQLVPNEIGLSLSGLNYTDMPIGAMYVNGSWGGGIQAYNNGNSSAGSVALPYPWRPGTKVTVKWSDDVLYERDKNTLYSVDVEVPPYSMIYSGYLWVAFFPDGEVKVYASGYYPGHANFPAGMLTPADTCKRTVGCVEWYRSGEPPREGYY